MYALEEVWNRLMNPALMADGIPGQRKRVAAPPPAPSPGLAEAMAAALANGGLPTTPTAPDLPTPRLDDFNRADGTAGPIPTAPLATLPPPGTPSPRIGMEVGPTASPLARKMAEYRALQGADVSSPVAEQPWGYEVGPPKKPSRLREALGGALQGAAIASQGPTEGAAWRALGGAGVGAAAGGISPRLMQSFNRHQELGRTANQVGQMQEVELGAARIGGVQAQAERDRLEPVLRTLQLERQMDQDAAMAEDRRVRRQQADETNRIRQQRADEYERANREREKKTGKQRRTWNLGGQLWEEGDDGVVHPKPGSPPPTPRRDIPGEKRTEKQEKRETAERRAASLYQKGHDYWEQAKAKRAEAESLTRGSTNYEERYKALIREAQGLETKTREVQLEGDKLSAEAASTPADTGGRTIKGAIEAFRLSQKREPTADEIARMQAALNR